MFAHAECRMEYEGWRDVHVGFEGDELKIGGVKIWETDGVAPARKRFNCLIRPISINDIVSISTR
jgi:hypothetical protein